VLRIGVFDAASRKKYAKRAEYVHTSCSLILVVSAMARGAFPVIFSAEPIERNPLYQSFHEFMVVFVVITALLLLFSWHLKVRLGHPAAWTTLQALCNKLQQEVFPLCKASGAHLIDDHRVTLFRHQNRALRSIGNSQLGMNFWKRVCGVGQGWLVPVLRSGDASRTSNSIFRASRNDRASKAEGIAGRAWGADGAVTVHGLPLINNASSEEDIKDYASKTMISVDRIRACIAQNKPLARSFWAHRVKMQGGTSWGVVVLDSMSPDEINNTKAEDGFKWLSEAATELLKEVS